MNISDAKGTPSPAPGGCRDTGRISPCSLYLRGESARVPGKLEQTAVHEAAHTVVATMVRRGIVDEVFVSETPVEVTEYFHEVNATGFGVTGGIRFRELQTTLFEDGLIAYSGFFAECELLFQAGVDLPPLLPQLRRQASHDVDRFLELLASENLSEAEIQNVVRDIGSALKHYFDSGLWESIEKVAAALLERRRLSGEEVLELLQDLL